MTCREKLKMEHPNEFGLYLLTACPCEFGYAEDPADSLDGICDRNCSECWEQEVITTGVANHSLIDEICEARKKFIDAGFSANEAFNLVWDIFKGRWEK